MKRLLVILITLFAVVNCFPQLIKWHTFAEALELNKKEPRKIVIDVYTDWCGWCKVMEKNTYNHKIIAIRNVNAQDQTKMDTLKPEVLEKLFFSTIEAWHSLGVPSRPYAKSASPLPGASGVSATEPIQIVLVNLGTEVPVMRVNGTEVAFDSAVDGIETTLTYTPSPGYTGPDSFDYVVTDGTDGTVHYWKLDGDAADAVGASHGTVTGTTPVPGVYGTAMSFDEVDDHVVVPDFNYNDSFTISFRFKIDDNTGNQYQYIYSHGNVSSLNAVNIFLGEEGSANAGMLRTKLADSNDTDDAATLSAALEVDISGSGDVVIGHVEAEKVDTSKDTAIVYLNDVYLGDGLKGVPRGTVKKLRVYELHYGYNGMGGHIHIGIDGPWDARRILGTVDVEADGSALFRVPANAPTTRAWLIRPAAPSMVADRVTTPGSPYCL